VTASIGVALVRPAEGDDPGAALWRLIDRADAAMYEAKQQGRNRIAARWVPAPRAALPREAELSIAVPRPPAAGVA
jgi:predicted signal transduction protein with EAL and GGDEF domain